MKGESNIARSRVDGLQGSPFYILKSVIHQLIESLLQENRLGFC